MNKAILSLITAAPIVWGACAATVPPPVQRMADAESAQRSARELGANNEPSAQLSLKLADEQIAEARAAMKAGENQRAEGLLIRAKADAELAIAKAREKNAQVAGKDAVTDAAAQKATNVGQGAM
ncbi:MAG TPA: DUF4398 domain-containing protein [Polyangiaceae bacterium]|nr:DUF4398 domain-containing protein [Polyangiaceae bacterium]